MERERPVTDAEIEGARKAIREQRSEIRAYLESEGVDTSSWDERPVSDEEFESMDEKVEEHFDHVRNLLKAAGVDPTTDRGSKREERDEKTPTLTEQEGDT